MSRRFQIPKEETNVKVVWWSHQLIFKISISALYIIYYSRFRLRHWFVLSKERNERENKKQTTWLFPNVWYYFGLREENWMLLLFFFLFFFVFNKIIVFNYIWKKIKWIKIKNMEKCFFYLFIYWIVFFCCKCRNIRSKR